jgi:hypothetical protein
MEVTVASALRETDLGFAGEAKGKELQQFPYSWIELLVI